MSNLNQIQSNKPIKHNVVYFFNTMNISNSTYGITRDSSFCGENFKSITLHWNCGIQLLKIRIANWKPKQSRDNCALFYYDVKTEKEATDIIDMYKNFNFKEVEEWYEKKWVADKPGSTTGVLYKWYVENVIPEGRSKFKQL